MSDVAVLVGTARRRRDLAGAVRCTGRVATADRTRRCRVRIPSIGPTASRSCLSWLSRHDIEQEWTIATALAAAGVDDRLVRSGGIGAPRCRRLQSGSGVGGEHGARAPPCSREVKESTTRISELVAAVRSYSQMDRASMQHIDVTEGLESTLIMLGHKLRDAVTVVRDYGADVPLIDAYAGELNQVWTNLIDNAVDAMDGSGTLHDRRPARRRPRTGRDPRHRLRDDAGSPSACVRSLLHDQGRRRGTGLGLDIAQRIVVDRHGGEIAIDSVAGWDGVRRPAADQRASVVRPEPVLLALRSCRGGGGSAPG